jgi:hypothetical protein
MWRIRILHGNADFVAFRILGAVAPEGERYVRSLPRPRFEPGCRNLQAMARI